MFASLTTIGGLTHSHTSHQNIRYCTSSQVIPADDLDVIGKYIQSDTVIPLNVYKVTAEVFDFVLNGPFG